MRQREWLRWAALHGGTRAYLARRAKRGHPFEQILSRARKGVDPYPLGEQIRQQGRLVQTPFIWVTADHELCKAMLRDNRFGVTSIDTMDFPKALNWIVRKTDMHLASPVDPPSMLAIDPPDHTRHRKLVAQTFTPRAIGRLEGRVTEVTDELLGELEQKGDVDLVAEFASRIPVAIIAEILGVPADMHAEMLRWGHLGAPLLDNGLPWKEYHAANEGLRAANAYLSAHIERLRSDPGDNILSRLTVDGDLDHQELLATAFLVLGAGFETTVNLIGTGIVTLLVNPDQLALLRADPSLWPNAVEEILRYDSPVQMTVRTANAAVELAGERIAPGAMTAVLIGSANRDPAVFEDPMRFDVTRQNARDHLSFGSGIHACLGAALARMEGAIALRTLFERFPDLRIDGQPTRRRLTTLRGYEHLPVSLGRAAVSQPS